MSESFIIRGGKSLKGSIPVYGSKNAALKGIAASLLFDGPVVIDNIPRIEDIHRLLELMAGLGASYTHKGKKLILEHKKLSSVFNMEISKRLRASVVLTAPILARTGHVTFPYPGGCVIGERPIDLFLKGFRAMGASIVQRGKLYTISARKLLPIDFIFHTPSVTATETFMMAATAITGTTVLRNAAQEPEIIWLADFLNQGGANIHGAGTHTITIRGRAGKGLRQQKPISVLPDRIEAGTFVILAAALASNAITAKSKITITRCEPEHIRMIISILREAGFIVKEKKSSISIAGKAGFMKSVSIKTGTYPGFPTDMQAPYAVLLTQLPGSGEIFETIFPDRFQYIGDLKRMGAHIKKISDHAIRVQGASMLQGTKLRSPDLRAGLAYIIASLIAKNTSLVHNVYQIDRGYEKIEERLQRIGADIKRIKTKN